MESTVMQSTDGTGQILVYVFGALGMFCSELRATANLGSGRFFLMSGRLVILETWLVGTPSR